MIYIYIYIYTLKALYKKNVLVADALVEEDDLPVDLKYATCWKRDNFFTCRNIRNIFNTLKSMPHFIICVLARRQLTETQGRGQRCTQNQFAYVDASRGYGLWTKLLVESFFTCLSIS